MRYSLSPAARDGVPRWRAAPLASPVPTEWPGWNGTSREEIALISLYDERWSSSALAWAHPTAPVASRKQREQLARHPRRARPAWQLVPGGRRVVKARALGCPPASQSTNTRAG